MKVIYEKTFEKAGIDEIAIEVLKCSDVKIFCFKGDLGMGKTALVSAISKGLGCQDLVHSPTFSIVNEYIYPKGKIFHFDLYRLKTIEEVMDIGFEEYIYSDQYCFIEWPEIILNQLPKSQFVTCQLSYVSLNERKISLWAN